MMKVTSILFLLAVCSSTLLLAQQEKSWRIGARGGAVGIPYGLSSSRLGTGAYIGLAAQASLAKKTGISCSLDFRKVNNLFIEKQEQFYAAIPDAVSRGTEYLSLTGFAGFVGGLHLEREIKRIATGRLKLSLDVYAEQQTTILVKQQSAYNTTRFGASLVESDSDSYLTSVGGTGAVSTYRSTTEDLSVIYSGGIGLIYEFAEGPQLSCGVQIDLTDRFSLFAGSSDAKLTQIHIGFTYPFVTKIN